MSTISTHVLDTAAGRPAKGVPVHLEARQGDGWRTLGRGETDADGRISGLAPDGIETGVHRITFDTAAYFSRSGLTGFYPEVRVVFEIGAAEEHYHVPLLLSPYGYSTYRGS